MRVVGLLRISSENIPGIYQSLLYIEDCDSDGLITTSSVHNDC